MAITLGHVARTGRECQVMSPMLLGGTTWSYYQLMTTVVVMKANGTLIRRKRAELGHGMNRFATLIGITGAALSRIETGKRNPRPENLKKIADALGCRITDIAEHGADMQEPRPGGTPGGANGSTT